MKSMINGFKVFVLAAALFTASGASAQTVWDNYENDSKWKGSSEVAVGDTGNVTTSYSKSTSTTPSLDGRSTKFFLGGTDPFTNAIWWNRVGEQDSATNFKLEFQYYIKDPAASQGYEFALSQTRGGYRYKFSTQCSFNKGIFQVWDTANARWVATTIPCLRPKAYTWIRMVAEYKRANGKAVFVAVTINGQKYYFNKSFNPEPLVASAINTHFQLNGNRDQKDYSIWVDKYRITVW